VRARLCKLNKERCNRLAVASDKVYQLLDPGPLFSPGTPATSITKTDCHDIAGILLKMALNAIPPSKHLLNLLFLVIILSSVLSIYQLKLYFLLVVFVCMCVCVYVCVCVCVYVCASNIDFASFYDFQSKLGTVPILWYVLFSFHD
jgi:hypothetical protein